MAVSLKFHTDSALTTPVASLSINHLADGSGDPQDFVFYLGSNQAANKFENNNAPGVGQLTVSIANATAIWQASTAYVVGNTVRSAAKNGYRYKVQSITGGGASGASEPSWPLTVGQTVADNEVTWVNDGPIHESTEVKLAAGAAGLDSAVAGAGLDVGTVINGGSANAVEVHMRIDDATAIIGQATELSLTVADVLESVA